MNNIPRLKVRLEIEHDDILFTRVLTTGVMELTAVNGWKAMEYKLVKAFTELRRDIEHHEVRK